MNKRVIALAVLGLCASLAHAQSNVIIYGVVDTGYIKENGRDVRMADNDNSRIGFRGAEDLGNGLKATFQLEKRFDLNDGTLGNTNTAGGKGSRKGSNQKDWDGAANLGLAGNWGQVRFGRINELTTETIRRFDPFNQIGIGSQIYSLQRNARIDNTARYDSPKWSGFSFGLSYSLGGDTSQGGGATSVGNAGADNDGYAINLSYDNGPLSATANWSRIADSDNSYVWNVGLGYKFIERVRLTVSYEDTKSKGWRGGNGPGAAYDPLMEGRERNALLGVAWEVGPGVLNGSFQYNRLKDAPSVASSSSRDSFKYALGYTYFLSKRTDIYGIVAYTDFDDKDTGYFYSGSNRDSLTGVQIGVTHRF